MDGPAEGVDLGVLDPGTSDDLYWPRFHAEVMRAAEPALASRRASSSGGATGGATGGDNGGATTLGAELLRLGRYVVPGVALAASVAAMILVSPSQEAGGLERALLGIDDVLMERVTGRAAELSGRSDSGLDRNTFMIALEERRR
ncbi:MAG: hypothetical protein EA351_08860 [Gemmatimonadales bacterium]|nr:MAG: hypothetical protein EA351_08860 [Gemmatimonadales bacterium]